MKLFKRRWQISILALMLISLACNLTLPGLPAFIATPTPTPQPLAPTLVETVPQIGSELPLQAPLLIYFSEPMDQASVQSALTADLSGGFLFNWMDASTLSLTPKVALPPDQAINFSLGTGAKAANGLAVLQPINFSYQTVGALRVAQILPAAQARDVSPDSAVVVAFNQPVVALGATVGSSLPVGFSIDPAAPGKGEWLNTSTYIFHPDPALSGGSDYTIHINPQLTSTSGAGLDAGGQNVIWTFHTSFPALQAVSPKPSDGTLALDAPLQLTFNQPMQRASVEGGFALSGPAGKLAGNFTWNDKSTVLTFTPSALLVRDTQYILTLSGQARSAGGAVLGSDSSFTFQSVAPFSPLETSFQNGSTRPSDKNVLITFTTPIGEYTDKDLAPLIVINPQPADGGFHLAGAVVVVNGLFDAGKTYSVTFSKDLKDRWGQALGNDYVFTFKEPDAAPSIQFDSYLPALFTSPDQPLADVQAVNVHTFNVQRGTFSPNDFFSYENDYNFQKSYLPADLQSWVQTPTGSSNQNSLYTVNFSQDGKALPTGLYYVDVKSNEAPNPFPTSRVMLLSHVNLTLKTSATLALVWATDLRTQGAAAGVPLTLYDATGHSIATGTTDANGLWQGQLPLSAAAQGPGQAKTVADTLPGPAQGSASALGTIYAMLGQPGDDLFGMAVSNWNQEISPWDFALTADTTASPSEKTTYMYTERPIYRPGDTVHFRGVIRSAYNGRYGDAGISSLSASLTYSGAKLADSTLPVSAYGSFNGEFSLPAGTVPGYYAIETSTGNKDDDGIISFQVADYRKPEINLSVKLSPSPALSGQTLTGKVQADYFFGAPVGDLPFSWSLYTSPSSFAIPEFQTGLYQNNWLDNGSLAFGSNLASGTGRTGPDGSFSIPLTGVQVDDTTQLTLEITASDSGGFPVSARDTLTMHPAPFYAGVRPGSWFGQAGTPLSFDILSVGWDEKTIPNKTLTASFQKVTWERTDLTYSYEFTPTYTPVDSKQITTDAGGQAQAVFTPADAGTYMLDVSGGGARSQVLVWVGGTQNAAWPNLPYQHVQLTADKNGYKPGDNAAIFIPNPFGVAATALITTERSTILSSQVVSIPAGGYTFNLPITDQQAPNTYISATLLGPDNDFRQGYVDLPVEPSAFELNVDLKATPEKAHPGDQVTLDLTVTDSKGQPVRAEFSMAAVDLAALALADPNSQDILPAYYSNQPLGVQTGLSAAVYARRFFVGPLGRGGGGGGDEQTITVREKFPDTAYWKADIVTDAQGKAQISFTLPDSLTTWQVESRGLTQDTKVGQARVTIITSKDLLIRPQTPSFLVVGDTAELAAIVNNTSSSALDGTASLQVSGFSLDKASPAEQKIHIPANGSVRVAWSGLVQAADNVQPVFSVSAGSLRDASGPADGPIPVLHYTASQTFSTAGVLSQAATRQEIMALPKTFQPLGGKLDLELSPSLAAAILSTLRTRQPGTDAIDWSNELLASDFLPQLATYETLKAADLSDPALSAAVSGPVTNDIRRLLANQSYSDGGWSWTSEIGLSSDPYLSAYILFALNQVGKSGLNVDASDALQRGHTYLMSAPPLDGKSDLTLAWELNQGAFDEYVLAQTGGANLDYIDTIYAGRDKLDPWAKALLAETLLSISPTDTRAGDLLSNVESGAIRSATGVHWESSSGDRHAAGSPLFTTALVVYSLSQQTPVDASVADAVRYLAAQRTPGGFSESSYEDTWIVLALDQFMKSSGDLQGNFTYSAALNGVPLAKGQAGGAANLAGVPATVPLTQLDLSGANSLLISREAGPGSLYYRAALTVDRPVETAPALSQGLSVSREFLTCQAKDCQPVSSYQMKPDASGRVQVQLTVTLMNDAYYLMVQDNIPAGAEILDSSLKTSQQGQPDQSVQALPYDNSDPFADGWGWWYFNTPQIYSDHILWSANYLPAGTYVLTYTIIPSLPGKYRVLPAHAWQAYFPEVQGTSAGAVFEIKGQ